jgi:uncharacterized protein
MRLLACAALALTLLSGSSARAEVARPTGPKADDIRKLLVMTGSAQLGAQVMAQLMQSMKKAMPNVPERFWADFQKEVRTDELIDLIVPVYDRHLSHDDVKALIRFYETPSGKKFVSVLPQITQESMSAGETWGRGLAERVIARLKAEEGAAGDKGDGKKSGGTKKK